MFDVLFPGWSNPVALATIVALRLFGNLALSSIAADAVGVRDRLTVGALAGTALSTGLTVLALRPGVVGLRGSYVELGVQALVVVLAWAAVYANPSRARVVAAAAATLAAVALLLVTIPIYGEAFVAP